MKKRMSKMASAITVLAVVVLAVSGTTVMAQEEDNSLGITFDTTYTTQYIWRGFDLYSDKPALQPSLDFDLGKIGLDGFGVNVWGSWPMGSDELSPGDGINKYAELDYTLKYDYTLFGDEAYAMGLSTQYVYYHYPMLNHMSDAQEMGAGVELPSLFKVGEVAIVPSYYGAIMWATSSASDVATVAGWYHQAGLSADVPVYEDIALSLSSAIGYNDGVLIDDSGVSHALFGVGTSIPVGPFSINPFINYQVSMEDQVNQDDEFFGGLSVSVAF